MLARRELVSPFSWHETAARRLCPGLIVRSADPGQGLLFGRTQTGRPF